LKYLLGIVLFLHLQGAAQLRFSVGTDVSIIHNFSPKQQYSAFGQTVETNLHFNQKESLYGWIAYFAQGSFKNSFTATAKSSSTVPASINYKVKGKWRTNEFSVGWKHYFRGNFDSEYFWNFYGTAGFGLMIGKVENSFDQVIDTSVYDVPPAPVPGNGQFTRLTLDLGLGIERSVGGNVYLYGNLRTWLPTTNYPSAYLHSNENVPLPLIFSAGIRVLFGFKDDQ
jgi:hypothetical protein